MKDKSNKLYIYIYIYIIFRIFFVRYSIFCLNILGNEDFVFNVTFQLRGEIVDAGNQCKPIMMLFIGSYVRSKGLIGIENTQ